VLPVAVDAMGGDRAPTEIVAGARRAADELGVPVVLVGPPDRIGDAGGLPVIEAHEVIAMDEDPAKAVRRKKDSTLLRAAEAVRDGKASAMVSAGNTGAAMAAALFRMGRIKGVSRPAIATPIPNPGGTPTVLLDAGANADCQADWLVQFAQMGAVYARDRFGIAAPRVALLSIGEEASKGNTLVKETRALLDAGEWVGATGATFAGNVEGRDLIGDVADVVVTDGFTGNVALKAMEGSLTYLVGKIAEAIGADDDTRAAGDVLLPHLAPVAAEMDPDATGGAALLGVDGVCIISHGSSSATAIVNAVRVAADLAARDLPTSIAQAVTAHRRP
jgi:glycerol-3-phosphate acyltransferase PlsX